MLISPCSSCSRGAALAASSLAEDPGEMKAHITVVQSPSSTGIYEQEPETRALRSAHAVLSDALLIFDEIGLCGDARGFIYLFWEREEGKRPGGMGNREKKEGRKSKDKREVAMQLAFLSHLDLLAWPQLDGLAGLSTA